jgi:hypothetical protein
MSVEVLIQMEDIGSIYTVENVKGLKIEKGPGLKVF